MKKILYGLAFISPQLLGASDSGTVSVEANFSNVIKVSRLDNMEFSDHSAGNDMVVSDNFCVYRRGNDGKYKVTISGDGASSAFTLSKGTNTLDYTVKFSDDTTPSDGTDMTTNTESSSEFFGSTESRSCGGSDNTSIQITISDSDAVKAKAGKYTVNITILVSTI